MLTKRDDLLGSLIHDVAHLLRHEIDRRVAAHNLTRTKWLAISLLRDRPGVTQSDLARQLELGAAATGKLVARLMDRGFVERRADKTDRRANRLHLTTQAHATLKALEAEADALRTQVLGGLDQAEVMAVQAGLMKLKERLQSQGPIQ